VTDKASPYVRIYLPRSQAELIEKLLAWEAAGLAARHPYNAALKNVRKALAKNGGEQA
jgi:hypothetical protein